MALNLNDNRYQFLRFETVVTGKWVVPKGQKIESNDISGILRSTLGNMSYEITREVAVIFDKQKGEIKQIDIQKLNLK